MCVDDKTLRITFNINDLIKIHKKKCIRETPMKRVNFCTRNSAVACCCCSLFFPIMHSYKTERLDNYTATLPNTILLELCRAVRQPTAAAATTRIVTNFTFRLYFAILLSLFSIYFAGLAFNWRNIRIILTSSSQLSILW